MSSLIVMLLVFFFLILAAGRLHVASLISDTPEGILLITKELGIVSIGASTTCVRL